MKRRSFQKQTRRSAAGGFSLVELLTVIAIIVLLIGILVPALSHVRESAKVTATKATIGTFSTGLETFRADQQLGGNYPWSASDMMISNALTYQVWSPHGSLTGGRNIDMSGAGLLVFALAGADLLGCPGFKTFRSGSDYWAQDTDDRENGPDDSGAYALDPDTREPVHPRVSPFIDLSRVTVTKWNPNAQTTDGPLGSFEIPMEDEATESLGEQPYRRPYPMFLDDFGGPILYWRADPAGSRVADRSPTDSQALGPYRGIFHFADNADLLSIDEHPLQLTAGGSDHRLVFGYNAPLMPGDINLNDSSRKDNFAAYIRNKSIEARVTPQRKDSYLLISAGPDGVFGTADDIANFDHNGAELQAP
jgi:type II secretory pathway pseudopilin PulG